MSARPGRIAARHDFSSPITDRLDPAYAARVADLTHSFGTLQAA
jgi:hypothetical protein